MWSNRSPLEFSPIYGSLAPPSIFVPRVPLYTCTCPLKPQSVHHIISPAGGVWSHHVVHVPYGGKNPLVVLLISRAAVATGLLPIANFRSWQSCFSSVRIREALGPGTPKLKYKIMVKTIQCIAYHPHFGIRIRRQIDTILLQLLFNNKLCTGGISHANTYFHCWYYLPIPYNCCNQPITFAPITVAFVNEFDTRLERWLNADVIAVYIVYIMTGSPNAVLPDP